MYQSELRELLMMLLPIGALRVADDAAALCIIAALLCGCRAFVRGFSYTPAVNGLDGVSGPRRNDFVAHAHRVPIAPDRTRDGITMRAPLRQE